MVRGGLSEEMATDRSPERRDKVGHVEMQWKRVEMCTQNVQHTDVPHNHGLR